MDPERHQSQEPNPLTAVIRREGIAEYFSSLELTDTEIPARQKLELAADKLEHFLRGEGRDSVLADYYDGKDVGGLRECVSWVPDEVYLSREDFLELFSIATSAHINPFYEFRSRVEVFVEINGYEKTHA